MASRLNFMSNYFSLRNFLYKDKQTLKPEHNYNMHDIMQAIQSDDIIKFRFLITSLNPYDKAEILNSVSNDDFCFVIKSIYDLIESEALVELNEQKKSLLLENIQPNEVAKSISKLENDDIVHFISSLPNELRNEILYEIPRSDRKIINLALTYTKDQVGRLMDIDILKFSKDKKIEDIKIALQEIGDDLSEDTRDVFIVDEDNILIGMVNLFSLLTINSEQSVMSVLNHDFKTVKDIDDKSEIAYIFRKYNLTSLPVIGRDEKIIGCISSDSAIEILNIESDEEILRLGGVSENYEGINIFKKSYSRFIWLFFNLNAAFLSASVIGEFNAIIQKHALIAIFLPVVASIGGNSGNQTTILIIRMIAMKSINKLNRFSIFFRELFIGFVNGLMFLITGTLFAYLISDTKIVAIIFGFSLACNIFISSFLGFFIPILMKKINFDPATTSSIILTTITDFMGFFIFLSMIGIFLK